MFTLGAIVFILSGFMVLGTDKLYRKEKIKGIKTLLIIKSSGLLGSVLGALIMMYGKK